MMSSNFDLTLLANDSSGGRPPLYYIGRWLLVAVVVAIAGLVQLRYPRTWHVLRKSGRGLGWFAPVFVVGALLIAGLLDLLERV
jgi:hypothetical protein